ncbi:MAG TPA: hypothetical protein VE860_14425, partial [Chthoniobacterales bacterium]|nr:hypothetical protein [Chthoniobacterales bacterium]
YTNSVLGLATPEFLAFIEKHGITLEQAAAARQGASSDHNSRETPLFAPAFAIAGEDQEIIFRSRAPP